jgi:hypothetical protein
MAAFLSALLLFILGMCRSSRYITYNFSALFKIFLKVSSAAGLMALAVFIFKNSMNIVVLAFFGLVIYLGLLFLFKGIGKSDLAKFYKTIARK